MKLTPALISQWYAQPLPELDEVNASSKDINHIEDISICVNLHKLNLAKNRFTSPGSLSGLHYNTSLTLLNLSENQLEQLDDLDKLINLKVLNLSKNKLIRIPAQIGRLSNLNALVLNNNFIKRIDNLSSLINLNTLVLSYNQIENVSGISSLVNLTKLSLGHNQIRVFPELSACKNLKELRLNNNKILSIPDTIRDLHSLAIVDLGSNLFRTLGDVVNLSSLPSLVNLNLKGNKFCETPSYREDVLSLVSTLRILDGTRFDTKFLERKEKRQKFKELITSIEERRRRAAEQYSQSENVNFINVNNSKQPLKRKAEDVDTNTRNSRSKLSAVEGPCSEPSLEEQNLKRKIEKSKERQAKWGSRRKLLEKKLHPKTA